eukprot:jgi/Astpho2/6216/Aster-03623
MGKGSRATLAIPQLQQKNVPIRAFNFSAGAAMFDTSVMLGLQQELLSYEHSGMSLVEMSQRDAGGPVQQVIARAERNLRQLLQIPGNYRVLFQHGGAHAVMAALPLNLLGDKTVVDYVNGGVWSEKAAKEASKWARVHQPAGSLDTEAGLSYPPAEQWDLSPKAAYVHVCGNETMSGLAFHQEPSVGPGHTLVTDMTSSLLSRPVDVSKYGVIYASSGKNLGPAGVAVVIVREDLLGHEAAQTPSILSWATQDAAHNIYNTPNIFAIWGVERVTADLLQKGGLEAAGIRSARRAQQVYDALDGSEGFYSNRVDPTYRSHTAIPFRQLEDAFVAESTAAGLLQLFGHPLMGGLRVCIYNGLPDEAIDALLHFMAAFRLKYQGR